MDDCLSGNEGEIFHSLLLAFKGYNETFLFIQGNRVLAGAPSGWMNLATTGTRLHPLSAPNLLLQCVFLAGTPTFLSCFATLIRTCTYNYSLFVSTSKDKFPSPVPSTRETAPGPESHAPQAL
jgi:hypothetical protein